MNSSKATDAPNAAGGSDVVHTVVDGRVVYRDRRHATLSVPAAISEVAQIAREIAASFRG